MIERKREKEKDLVPIPFTGIAPNDLWKNTIPITTSIRSQKSIEASLQFSKLQLSAAYNLPQIQDTTARLGSQHRSSSIGSDHQFPVCKKEDSVGSLPETS